MVFTYIICVCSVNAGTVPSSLPGFFVLPPPPGAVTGEAAEFEGQALAARRVSDLEREQPGAHRRVGEVGSLGDRDREQHPHDEPPASRAMALLPRCA